MTGLPPALAPWRSALAVLPSEVQRTLGPWLLRLSRTVGRLERSRATDLGPPDGFAGLDRRGPYERLVTTEWLFAEELPDEFLRRAAAKEHLFLQQARRAPAGGLRSVVLFDGGPSQIGGLRLVHLAALVVFAQRATDAGAELRFGVLQSAPAPFEALTAHAAEHVLRARSPLRPTEAQWQAWLTAVSESASGPQPVDDLWVVGGPETRPWCEAKGRGHVEASDVLDPDRRSVQVTLRRKQRTRAVELDLPPAPDCIRALRDPLERSSRRVSPPKAAALGIRFSHDGRHLMIRTPYGVTALRVTRTPDETGGTLRRLRFPDADILAADSYKRLYFVLAATSDAVVLQYFRRSGRVDQVIELGDIEGFVRPGADQAMGPLIPLQMKGAGPRRLLVLDALQSPFVLELAPTFKAVPLDLQVVAVSRRASSVVALAVDAKDDAVALSRLTPQGGADRVRVFDADPPAAGFFGASPGGGELVAVRTGFDRWTFPSRGVDVFADALSAIGVVERPSGDGGRAPCVVSVGDDRRSIVLSGPKGLVHRHPLPFTMAEAAVATTHPLVAARSDEGAVMVLDLIDFSVAGRCEP